LLDHPESSVETGIIRTATPRRKLTAEQPKSLHLESCWVARNVRGEITLQLIGKFPDGLFKLGTNGNKTP
jgi:hypothetical protein